MSGLERHPRPWQWGLDGRHGDIIKDANGDRVLGYPWSGVTAEIQAILAWTIDVVNAHDELKAERDEAKQVASDALSQNKSLEAERDASMSLVRVMRVWLHHDDLCKVSNPWVSKPDDCTCNLAALGIKAAELLGEK